MTRTSFFYFGSVGIEERGYVEEGLLLSRCTWFMANHGDNIILAHVSLAHNRLLSFISLNKLGV